MTEIQSSEEYFNQGWHNLLEINKTCMEIAWHNWEDIRHMKLFKNNLKNIN